MYCNMIVIVVLANTSRVLHNYFFIVVEIIKSYAFSNFEVYNTVLLSRITMLCIKSPGLVCLLVESVYP